MQTKYHHNTTREFVEIIDSHAYSQADVAEILHEAAQRLDQISFRKDPTPVNPAQQTLF